MYTDETSQNRIKVYPNKDAIKQMKLKSDCFNGIYPNTRIPPLTVLSENKEFTQTSAVQDTDDSNAGLYYLLLIVLLLADGKDCDGTLFTLILSTMFLY